MPCTPACTPVPCVCVLNAFLNDPGLRFLWQMQGFVLVKESIEMSRTWLTICQRNDCSAATCRDIDAVTDNGLCSVLN